MSEGHVHITGLSGRRPIGALLRLGKKGDRGQPVEKDRWHILSTSMNSKEVQGRNGSRKVEYHAPHPDFADFHRRDLSGRQSVIVELEHVGWGDSVEIGFKRQNDKNGKAPDTAKPWCYTVGKGKAMRWNSTKGHHQPFTCLGRQCPEMVCGGASACKPSCTMYVRLVWPDSSLQSVAVRWSSGGWNSTDGIYGLQKELDRLWGSIVIQNTGMQELAGRDLDEILAATGAPSYSVAGLRVRLTVSMESRNGRRYPVVSATPLVSLGEWLEDHARRMARLRMMVHEPEAMEGEVVAQIAENPPPVEAVQEVYDVPLERVEKSIAWWGERGVDLETLEGWVGADVSDWTRRHIEDLVQRAKTWGKA